MLERAVQTDPTLLRYASAIMEQKKGWKLWTQKFDRFQTLRSNSQQHATTCNRMCKRTQHLTSTQRWELLANNVAFVARGLRFSHVRRNPICGWKWWPDGSSKLSQRTLLETPLFSTPIQILYFYILVSGQLQSYGQISRVPRVSAHENFHCI